MYYQQKKIRRLEDTPEGGLDYNSVGLTEEQAKRLAAVLQIYVSASYDRWDQRFEELEAFCAHMAAGLSQTLARGKTGFTTG